MQRTSVSFPTEEIAGYIVAKDSVKTLGSEICAAHILSTIFFFGLKEADRKEYIQEIITSLEETDRRRESGEERYYSHEEVFSKLEEEFFSDASEDEKAYHKAKKDIF